MAQIIADFFEIWGWAYLGPFSQYMYKADLYFETFLWLLIFPPIILFIYYVTWDNIRLAKNWIWFVIILSLSLIIGGIGFSSADAGIYDYLNQHHITNSKIEDVDYIYYSVICFSWTLFYSFILSLILKFFSVKGRYIPF